MQRFKVPIWHLLTPQPIANFFSLRKVATCIGKIWWDGLQRGRRGTIKVVKSQNM
jgi:hypothetical protein